LSFILSLICGVFGAVIFAKISHIKVAEFNTNLVLVAICFVAASQIGLTIMNDYSSKKRFFVAIFLCSFLSAVYASLVVTIEKLMPANLLNAQDLNFWHVIAVILLFAIWLIKLFWINNNSNTKPIFLKLYMKALNASQPSSNTITSNRNQYNYK